MPNIWIQSGAMFGGGQTSGGVDVPDLDGLIRHLKAQGVKKAILCETSRQEVESRHGDVFEIEAMTQASFDWLAEDTPPCIRALHICDQPELELPPGGTISSTWLKEKSGRLWSHQRRFFK